ncbi:MULTISPECIES: hypothetical protein [unclassified Rhodococcus (in: high G+C Gram-positive bacteria)]|uniref:hypothetical protein n=1 Tax=unclassified Rhodococcus (in: high G+C Gram-positive bacteria) TaxID=192944 RepID=UPI0007BBA573|nr:MULTISPECIES: hypothetical protein [unclassified Rhodococcus (in: high G+C Gram-positive bacteria)]KZE98234.1 hypothetical protein A2J02_12865 [Rhodococcus sp. EPR-147]KZF06923.1 hypothetical protein A2J04_03880 [Rhodococcus sp. EPR-279]
MMWVIIYVAFLGWLVLSTLLAVCMGTVISRATLEDEAAELRQRSRTVPRRREREDVAARADPSRRASDRHRTAAAEHHRNRVEEQARVERER